MGLVFLLIIALGLAGAACGEVGGEHRITENKYDTYVSRDADTKINQPTTLYFLDGVKDLPYVDMNEWGELMFYINNANGEDPDYGLSADYKGDLMIMKRENGYTMTLDFANDTITFDDFDAFVNCLPEYAAVLRSVSATAFPDKTAAASADPVPEAYPAFHLQRNHLMQIQPDPADDPREPFYSSLVPDTNPRIFFWQYQESREERKPCSEAWGIPEMLPDRFPAVHPQHLHNCPYALSAICPRQFGWKSTAFQIRP